MTKRQQMLESEQTMDALDEGYKRWCETQSKEDLRFVEKMLEWKFAPKVPNWMKEGVAVKKTKQVELYQKISQILQVKPLYVKPGLSKKRQEEIRLVHIASTLEEFFNELIAQAQQEAAKCDICGSTAIEDIGDE